MRRNSFIAVVIVVAVSIIQRNMRNERFVWDLSN